MLLKEARHKKSGIVGLNLYELFSLDESTQTGSVMVVRFPGNRELLLNGYEVSLWNNESFFVA
jgi:hypothetical protein